MLIDVLEGPKSFLDGLEENPEGVRFVPLSGQMQPGVIVKEGKEVSFLVGRDGNRMIVSKADVLVPNKRELASIKGKRTTFYVERPYCADVHRVEMMLTRSEGEALRRGIERKTKRNGNYKHLMTNCYENSQ